MQKASFNNDGSCVYAWTTPLDKWYAWDVRSVEPRIKYHGKCNLVALCHVLEFMRLLTYQKHRIGSPVQNIIAFGGTPAFVVRQGQNILLVEERSVTTTDPRCVLQLKGEILFERFATLSQTLLFVQKGKVSLLPITPATAGLIQVGSFREYTLDKRLQGARDIAVIGDQEHTPLQILVSFRDGSFERVVINDSHDVVGVR